MSSVSDLVFSRGCLLKTETVDGEQFYWLANPHFTSKLYSNLEELLALVQTLPITFSATQLIEMTLSGADFAAWVSLPYWDSGN